MKRNSRNGIAHRTRAMVAGIAILGLVTACGGSDEGADGGDNTENTAATATAGAETSPPTSNDSNGEGSGSTADGGDTGESGDTAGSGTGGPESGESGSGAGVTLEIGADGSGSVTVSTNEQLASEAAAALPDGKLDIAIDPSTPPYGFLENGDGALRGVDVDLGAAIAATLGVQIEWHQTKFPGILAGIQSNRYDTALSAMGDTPEREKTVDFVDYSTDSNAIVVPKGNPKGIKTIEDLCGLKLSTLEGSVFLGLLEQQNEKCAEKMDISVFPDINTALLQVNTGRADGTMYQTGVALYLIKTIKDADKLEVVTGQVYGEGYNAAPFNKDNAALRDLVQKALTQLADEGTYQQIYETWNLTPNTIDKFTVNDGIRFNQPS